MLDDILARLSSHLYAPLDRNDQFFVGYVGFTLLLAVLVLHRRRRSERPLALRDLTRHLFPRRIFLHASALLDYRFVALNYLVFSLVMGGMALGTASVSTGVLVACRTAFGESTAAEPGLLAAGAFTLCVYLAVDFGNFVGHWMQHRIPILWEFHKVHHSAEVLTPLTALRLHPVSEILGTQIIGGCVGIVNGVFLYRYGGHVAEITLYGVNAMTFLYYTIGAHHLAHSHVWIMFPRGIREIFYSPALHLIHHSNDPRHYNKNFAFSLTIWDRLAGTLYMPADREEHEIVLGLGEEEQRHFQSVWQLYATPFRNVASRLIGEFNANRPTDDETAPDLIDCGVPSRVDVVEARS